MNYQKQEKSLREKLARLEERLSHVSRDMSKSYSADSSEQAVERENDEVLEGIGQEAQLRVQNIRAALTRISAGTYGNCTVCGKPIDPRRLEALPETARCMVCAAD